MHGRDGDPAGIDGDGPKLDVDLVALEARVDMYHALPLRRRYQVGLDGRSAAWEGRLGLRVNR